MSADQLSGTLVAQDPGTSSSWNLTAARQVGAPLVLGALLLAAWEALVVLAKLPPYLVPKPSAIWAQIVGNASDIFSTMLVSGTNAVYGIAFGAIFGIVMAALAARWRVLDELVSPVAAAVATMPIVALAPLLNIMFSSTNEIPRRVIVTVVTFFPMFINTLRGLRLVQPVHAELMRSYAASAWQLTRTVRLPGAVPFVCTGLRLAASTGVIAAVVSEYFGGLQDGLGNRITSAASNTNYTLAWAYVAAAIMLGVTFYLAALAVERVATPWHHD